MTDTARKLLTEVHTIFQETERHEGSFTKEKGTTLRYMHLPGRLENAIAAYVHAAPAAPTEIDHLVAKLERIADAGRREDGSDIPLGEQVRQAAATLKAMQKPKPSENKEYNRFHFVDEEPFHIKDADGHWHHLGKGWLAITEMEYEELRAERAEKPEPVMRPADLGALIADLKRCGDPMNLILGPSRQLYRKAADALTRLEAEKNGWLRIVGQLAEIVPLSSVGATASVSDMIAYFKDLRARAERADDGIRSRRQVGDGPIKRLQDAVEGECDGLAITDAQAQAILDHVNEGHTLQERVKPWMMACFGEEISNDKVERGDRLLEEVFELLQSGGYDPARVLALRNYVWGREPGEPSQEAGGVQITLAAYCLAHGLDMHEAGETELARIWTKVDKIRAKQAAKPVGSALPIPTATEDDLFIGVGSEIRSRNRVGPPWEKGTISPSCEHAALTLVVNALAAKGFEIVRAVAA